MVVKNSAPLDTIIDLPPVVTPQTPYVANMRALWRCAPKLAIAIDQIDPLDLIECKPTRSNHLTCQLPNAAGQDVYLHSRYDPIKEAQKWVQGVEDLARQQEAQNPNRVPMCYFVDGFGLGYHIQQLFQSLAGEAFIVVSEPNLPLLRTALQHCDYSEMLDSERLIIITQADRNEIFNKLQDKSTAMMMGIVFTKTLVKVNENFHTQIHTLVAEYASFLRAHTISLLHNSIITCDNILKNLHTYVSTPPINQLKNRFAHLPAVVVSAGPSLKRNIQKLKAIRDNIVVIAVQTTLKPLLQYGITPDFVTSLDYHPVSRRFFEGLTSEQLSEVHLVAEPKANWSVIDYYVEHGPVSLLGNEFAKLVLGNNDEHVNIPPGATVAHLAFYLAQYIGADPIIFVGQDLGFTDNVYYSPGTALHSMWRPELNRFCTIEMKEWERIARHRNLLRKVKDIHGQDIYTDEQMFTYLQQFEKDFANSTAQVIDASEGGSQKQFCTTMPLHEVAEKYCQNPIDKKLFAYRDKMQWTDSAKVDQAQRELEKRIEEITEFKNISDETLSLVQEMLELLDDQPALNRKMVRLDELRTKVKHRPDVYRLVMYVSQGAEIYRFRADRKLNLESKEGKERQRRQLQRDISYVGEIANGCERLLGMLKECQEKIDNKVKADSEVEH
ncbi:MAG: DUF115 domain-containing protein [Sedimentisphaerales bacterium]|nr:DUF115 domain-containing protein [Sedimentisphaerales bacterium]